MPSYVFKIKSIYKNLFSKVMGCLPKEKKIVGCFHQLKPQTKKRESERGRERRREITGQEGGRAIHEKGHEITVQTMMKF